MNCGQALVACRFAWTNIETQPNRVSFEFRLAPALSLRCAAVGYSKPSRADDYEPDKTYELSRKLLHRVGIVHLFYFTLLKQAFEPWQCCDSSFSNK